MKGRTFKRCACPVQRDARGRRLACKKSHGSWSYVVDVPTGGAGSKRKQVIKGGFPTESAAEQALAEFIVAAQRGPLCGEPDRRTVGEYLSDWLQAVRPSLEVTAFTNYEAVVRLYVLPHLGAMPLRSLDAATLSALYGDLLSSGGTRYVKDERGRRIRDVSGAFKTAPAPLSHTTVRLVHRVLRRALAAAVRSGALGSNPAEHATAPRAVKPDTGVWSAEEAAAFLCAAREDRLYPAWLLALSCGLRRGELAGLRWDAVDLAAGTLAVVRQRTTDAASRVVEKEPKGTSRRSIDLGAAAVAALRAHRSRQAAERLAWGAGWIGTGLVFVHEDGSAYHPARLTELFQALAARAAVPVIRLHDARHSCATLALDAGIHPKVVQELLGHSSYAITMDLYSHRVRRLQRDAAARIEGAILGDEAVV